MAPGAIREAVDELKTIQVKSSKALELLILTKAVVLFGFLLENHKESLNCASHEGNKHEFPCFYSEEAVGRPLWPQTALNSRRQLVLPADGEIIIVIAGIVSAEDTRTREAGPTLTAGVCFNLFV